MAAPAGGAGVVAPATVGPIPPDVHFKMCKKIALLTKVVFHLNIKNEDSEAALAAVRRRYDEELQRVAEDAAEKLNRMAAAMANNPEVKTLEAALAELTDRYQRERADAQAALSSKEADFR